MEHELSIGAVSERSGVAPSALRFYEDQGLVHPERSESGHRRYGRDVLRRIAFIRVAQLVGLSLDDIRSALGELPDERTPNQKDWERLASSWTPMLDERIGMLQRLRDRLTGCIGCGCLSMECCRLMNPMDEVAERGPGARYVIDED